MPKPKPKKAQLSLGGLALLAVVVLAARLLGVGPAAPADSSSGLGDTRGPRAGQDRATAGARTPVATDDPVVEQLFRDRRSGVMVSVVAEVMKLLPDDRDGAEHQRFLVRLDSGRTLLVAHNTDLADPVPLAEHDTVTIRGQYEWTEKGGTLHWTHHDPDGRHEDGWIEHLGVRYE